MEFSFRMHLHCVFNSKTRHMKRLIVLFAATLVLFSSLQQAYAQQRIDEMWEQVSHYEEKGLPQSAIKGCGQYLQSFR